MRLTAVTAPSRISGEACQAFMQWPHRQAPPPLSIWLYLPAVHKSAGSGCAALPSIEEQLQAHIAPLAPILRLTSKQLAQCKI